MAKNITILGNSGFARECYLMLRALKSKGADIQFNGFLSFEGFQADLMELSDRFLGSDDDYTYKSDEEVIIAIGNPYLRYKAYHKLKALNVKLFTLIHPDVYIDTTVTLGEGNIFASGTYISCNCSIGNANVLNGGVHLGHDAYVGDFNFVGPGVQFNGSVRLGNCNQIGSLCVLLQNCHIGNNNIIAPLSAVYKGCKNNCYMLGNPALRVGTTRIA